MNNFRQDPEQFGNNSNAFNMSSNKSDSETRYTYFLKILIVLMGVLCVLRLITLDIMSMISDILGLVMLFFFYFGRSKCMAIFLMFNGIMGIVITFSKGSQIKQVADLNGGFTGSDQFSMGVCVFGGIVYFFECIMSAFGISRYSWDNFMGGSSGGDNLSRGYQSSYGSIGGGENNRNNNNQNSEFRPFTGRGTTLG